MFRDAEPVHACHAATAHHVAVTIALAAAWIASLSSSRGQR
jgi:hypothetical protein